ncbi:MAG: 3-hydroxyanthranilate 3,4-dioxygenase [Halobacteriovoraceae bacterium]|jgi:3-hydroxyanthranilate 3,4-dioxygenase|nr:3-hydroxyanthranilate 3,4-dioxygenase [Halobacteriovoraceae bacterium]
MKPFNFQSWIEENRELLKPPVGNKVVFKDSTFIVMAVGGPNIRTDFHINQTDEFFYQLEGEMNLRIVNEQGKFEDIPIKAGEVYMLRRGVPHSPQRMENSVGLVVEKTRAPEEMDTLQWYCKNCVTKLYEESFHLENIETQFGAVFDRYYNSEHMKCKECGTITDRVW